MKKEPLSIPVLLGRGVCILLAIWVVLAAPTGWLYDLWAGEGTGQGQKPTDSVQTLRRQGEVESLFLAGAPVTVTGGELVDCPLARLRDADQEGVHYKRGAGRIGVYISAYITADYPLSPLTKLLQSFAGVAYNRYYLAQLEDGAYICVYLDDYLAGTDSYPAGYLRYTTTQERRMLNEMARDYEVDSLYVLDMYRPGKVNWMLDLGLRVGVVFVAALLGMTARDMWYKRKKTEG